LSAKLGVQQPEKPVGSLGGGLAALKPVRQPIQPKPQESTDIEPMSEEEFDTEPAPEVEDVKPSLTKTILSSIASEEEKPAEPEVTIDETPSFADVVKPRGPPGGGRLVRDGAPSIPVKGPPTRGPPGIENEPTSEDEEEEEVTVRTVLKPAQRRVLEPVVELESSESESVAVLKPVTRSILTPISDSDSNDEEE
jgi:hypothetical protein